MTIEEHLHLLIYTVVLQYVSIHFQTREILEIPVVAMIESKQNYLYFLKYNLLMQGQGLEKPIFFPVANFVYFQPTKFFTRRV